MKSLYLTEEHELFRQSLRSFLDKEAMPYIDQWEEERKIPREIWKKMGDMGFLGLGYPTEYGGSELDFFYDMVFTEEITKCFSGGFAVVQLVVQYMSAPYILKYGSEKLKQKYLPGIISGDKISSIGITEPSAGSDVANIKTTARREGDYYIVNGSKTFITNAVYGDFIVTVVKTDPSAGPAGVSLLVIDRDAEGVSATKLKKLGWHASDTAELGFDNVKVPAENLIGEEGSGFYYLMGGLQLERLIAGVGGYAGCEHAVQHALKYMKDREAFGRPLTKFQVLRHRIAQLASEIESVKQFVQNCAYMHEKGEYVVKECSMAKLLATELSDKTMTQCLQFFGGYGYIEEYKIARLFRDSRIGTIGGGSSEIMREIISKMVIDDITYEAASIPSDSMMVNGNGDLQANKGVSSILEGIQASASKASPLGSKLKFDFGQEQLMIDGTGASNQVSTSNEEANCTVQVSLDDFKSLVKGQLNPMSAVMSGKIKINGDMGVAMKLQSLFS
ncbi:MAG: acyl-CoA dehydrogenase family protein [Bacteroidota bacterium]